MSSARDHKPREREYFASYFTVAATVGSVLFFLYLIFPKQSLMEFLSVPRKPDPLVRDYLATLLQVEPGDHGTRFLLARQEVALGNSAGARELLKPLVASASPAFRWEALRITYEVTLHETFSRKETTQERRDGIARLHELLEQMAEGPWGGKELERLARDAIALGNPKAAIRFLERKTQLDFAPQSAAGAAEMALSVGEYRRSAQFYFLARSRESDTAARRKWFLAAMRSMQAGNLSIEALAEAEGHMGGLEDDRETLIYLARLAFSAGRGDLAETYLKRLLKFGG